MKKYFLAFAFMLMFAAGCAGGGADRPELSLFSMHKSDYERVVEMARSGGLQHSDECSGADRYALPSGMETLSVPCVSTSPYDWFSVSFAPLDSYYRIVYVEEPDKITLTPECSKGDAAIIETLGKKWFLCKGEWN